MAGLFKVVDTLASASPRFCRSILSPKDVDTTVRNMLCHDQNRASELTRGLEEIDRNAWSMLPSLQSSKAGELLVISVDTACAYWCTQALHYVQRATLLY